MISGCLVIDGLAFFMFGWFGFACDGCVAVCLACELVRCLITCVCILT